MHNLNNIQLGHKTENQQKNNITRVDVNKDSLVILILVSNSVEIYSCIWQHKH